MKSLLFISGVAALALRSHVQPGKVEITNAEIGKKFEPIRSNVTYVSTGSTSAVYTKLSSIWNSVAGELQKLANHGSVPSDKTERELAFAEVVGRVDGTNSEAEMLASLVKAVNNKKADSHHHLKSGMTALAGALENIMKQLVALGRKLDQPAFDAAVPRPFTKIEELKEEISKIKPKEKSSKVAGWIVLGVAVAIGAGAAFIFRRK